MPEGEVAAPLAAAAGGGFALGMNALAGGGGGLRGLLAPAYVRDGVKEGVEGL